MYINFEMYVLNISVVNHISPFSLSFVLDWSVLEATGECERRLLQTFGYQRA